MPNKVGAWLRGAQERKNNFKIFCIAAVPKIDFETNIMMKKSITVAER